MNRIQPQHQWKVATDERKGKWCDPASGLRPLWGGTGRLAASAWAKLLLHSLLMKAYACRLIARLFACVLLCTGAGMTAHADTAMNVTANFSGGVVSCNVSMEHSRKHIAKVLREGTEVSVHWEIDVAAIREYWLNRAVATVAVDRRVVPDLVSRSWRLIDITSGISRRVFNLEKAVRFLTHLNRFPVIDRSLLEAGHRYRLEVAMEENEGGPERGWLSTWLGSGSGEASAEFALP